MGPFTFRRARAAAAALAAGLAAALAGCGTSPGVPSLSSPVPNPTPAGGITTGGTSGPGSAAAPSACSLLRSADVLAVAATFRDTTITIDGHSRSSQPIDMFGFNQKGVFASGGDTVTLSGDMWAQLTVIANGNNVGDYSPDGPAVHGLGNDAYWDPGSDTVVVLVGRNVFQVVDDVPVNSDVYPNLGAARQRAATALAAKILGHVQPGA
jgi:hypothetical protein